MKNYIVSDYQNWGDLAADLTAELNELISKPIISTHSKFGDCTFTNFTVSINDSSANIIADFTFATENKKLAINILITRGLLTVADNATFELLKQFSEQLTDLQVEVKTISRQRFIAQQEAEKEARERAKQEAKYQARMDKAINDFELMTRKDRGICASGEFYYNLGWLVKNVGTISAAMPDYLLKYFERHFGTEYKPTVVDSKKRTVNGNAMQWTLSMKASIAKKAVDTIPEFIAQYLNPTKTALTNTEFIWDIVENYGFKFGKTQDIDEIKKSIPDFCLDAFEKGYNSYTGEEGYAA